MIAMNAGRSSARQGRMVRRAVSRPNNYFLSFFAFFFSLRVFMPLAMTFLLQENNGNAPRELPRPHPCPLPRPGWGAQRVITIASLRSPTPGAEAGAGSGAGAGAGAGAEASLGAQNSGAFVHLRFDEDADERRIEQPVVHLHAENVERALRGNGAFVWAVARGERVVDVGHRHHARLDRDAAGREFARIAAAVEFLVMRVGDVGDGREVARPRDLLQEVECVRDVALDLDSLGCVEIAFADREDARFFGIEE